MKGIYIGGRSMADELKKIKEIKTLFSDYKEKWSENTYKHFESYANDIEKVLKDYDALDQEYRWLQYTCNDLNNQIVDLTHILKILKRYIKNIEEYDDGSYWIFFDGFEGENGDLTKDEYDLLKEVLLWDTQRN